MEGNALAPGSLGEFLERHPEVSWPPCPVDGVWHATVSLDCGYGYASGRTEGELLAKLAGALEG
jgi:hypothetical protein